MSTKTLKTYEERGLTSEKFDEILSEIVMANKGDLLDIPGIHEILSEYYNNEVLEAFDEDQPRQCKCGGYIDEDGRCDECDSPKEA